MRTAPSMLTPFVRSDAVGALLAELFLHPRDEQTLADLGRRTGLVPSLVHREVSRLIEAEVLLERRVGNYRLARPNQDHPLYAPMTEIIVTTYGPVPVLRDLLTGIDGVGEAWVYGSWAARRSGVSGPRPRDVDLLIVGTASRDTIYELARQAEAVLRQEVNPHWVTPERWAARAEGGDPFLQTVIERPMVRLV